VLAVCRFYHPSCCQTCSAGSMTPRSCCCPMDPAQPMAPSRRASAASIHDATCRPTWRYWAGLYSSISPRKKKEVMARKKACYRDIPAVTQLFTPHWIVRYWWENSLGRAVVLEPSKPKLARGTMPYYIEGRTRRDRTSSKSPKAEEIALLDPRRRARGHMLTLRLDLLSLIYAEEATPQRDSGPDLRHKPLRARDLAPVRPARRAGALCSRRGNRAAASSRARQLGTAADHSSLQNVQFEGTS